MLNLNLISKEDKDAFRFIVYRRAVLYMGSAAGITVIIFMILLVPSFLFLNFQRKEILRELAAEENAMRTFGVEEIERRVTGINGKIASIRANTAQEYRTSEIVGALTPLAGGVRIGEIKIDFRTRSIEARGIAPTRTALLAFRRSLEESGLVIGVSAPLSDLIKLTEIAFTLKGVLK